MNQIGDSTFTGKNRGGSRLKKKIMLFAASLITMCAIAGCQVSGGKGNGEQSSYNNAEDKQKSDGSKDNTVSDHPAIDNSWQSSYKDIINYSKEYLIDPYGLRDESVSDRWIYLKTHDFNDDGIPELIFGDNVSINVFSYQDNKIEKIIDLYEPEGWYSINRIYYRRNSLILVSDGSSGSGYVCLTYKDGKYVTGFFDDYNPTVAAIDEQDTTFEAFSKIFNISDLSEKSKVPLIMMVGSHDDISIRLKDGEPSIPLTKIDLTKLSLK